VALAAPKQAQVQQEQPSQKQLTPEELAALISSVLGGFAALVGAAVAGSKWWSDREEKVSRTHQCLVNRCPMCMALHDTRAAPRCAMTPCIMHAMTRRVNSLLPAVVCMLHAVACQSLMRTLHYPYPVMLLLVCIAEAGGKQTCKGELCRLCHIDGTG
jgi:hypothetical protein